MRKFAKLAAIRRHAERGYTSMDLLITALVAVILVLLIVFLVKRV
jgi:biopolymer transport protein ExbD